jgi:high-affinity iron transporter
MDFSAALPTFLITLREGVEAALVVGIVLACLKKAEQSQLNSWVYAGVGVGIAASVMVGVVLGGANQALSNYNQPYAPAMQQLLEGVFGVIAIAMLSWMLIWMTQQAKSMKASVEGAIADALQQNAGAAAGWGVFSLIFIAVLREGFETVLFIVAKFQQGWIPALGAFGGLAVAAGIGLLLFKWGAKIDIRLFFQIMGVFLLLIVAGLVVSALKHFDSAVAMLAQINSKYAALCFDYGSVAQNRSCILGSMVWNTSNFLPDNKFPGIVLKALFGYRDKLYIVQAVGYVLFLITIGGIYLSSITKRLAATDGKSSQNPAISQQD